VNYAILGCLLLVVTLARADEPTYSVERDNNVVCSMQPEQVAANSLTLKVLSMRCTTSDKVPGVGHQEGKEDRVVWFVRVRGHFPLRGPVSEPCLEGYYVTDDESGATTEYGCGPARESNEPAYSVEIDPGATCRMRPEEVATKAEGKKILSMRCTTMEKVVRVTDARGDPDRSAVWYVRARGHWVNLRTPPGVPAQSFDGEGFLLIDDADGFITGRGASPDPGSPVPIIEMRPLQKGR
jgi:hypothetical protein